MAGKSMIKLHPEWCSGKWAYSELVRSCHSNLVWNIGTLCTQHLPWALSLLLGLLIQNLFSHSDLWDLLLENPTHTPACYIISALGKDEIEIRFGGCYVLGWFYSVADEILVSVISLVLPFMLHINNDTIIILFVWGNSWKPEKMVNLTS